MRKTIFTIAGAALALGILTTNARKYNLNELLEEPVTRMIDYADNVGDTAAVIWGSEQALKMNKDNYIAYMYLAGIAEERGDSVAARKYIEKYMKSAKGTDAEGLGCLMYSAYLRNDSAKYVDVLLQAMRFDNSEVGAYNELGNWYMERGDTLNGIRYLENMVSVEPTVDNYSSFLSKLKPGTPKYYDILAQAVRNCETKSDTARFMGYDALNMLHTNMNGDSEVFPPQQIVDRAVDVFRLTGLGLSDSGDISDGKLVVYLVNSTYPELMRAAMKKEAAEAVGEEQKRDAYVMLSDLMADASPEESLEASLRASTLYDSPRIRYQIGTSLYNLDAYGEALKYLTGDTPQEEYLMAECEAAQGDLDGAFARMTSVIENCDTTDMPDYASYTAYLVGRARLAMAMKNYRQAVSDYEHAIKQMETPYAPVLNNLGDALSRMGRQDKAEIVWQCALDSIKPEEEMSMAQEYWQPLMLYKLGKTAEAEALLKKVLADIDNTPESAQNMYNLACVYCTIGDKEKALKALDCALRHGADPYHADIDYDLEILRTDPRYIEMTGKAKEEIAKKVEAIRKKAAGPIE